MEVMFTKNLIGSFRPPPLSDMRWRIFMLLFFYLILGMTMLGFSRKPLHILLLIGGGALLDLVLNLLIRKQKIFPLSAMISCCSLVIWHLQSFFTTFRMHHFQIYIYSSRQTLFQSVLVCHSFLYCLRQWIHHSFTKLSVVWQCPKRLVHALFYDDRSISTFCF